TLSIDNSGDWNYHSNNALLATQQLAQGEHAQDVFTARVTDSQGLSDAQTVTIDVVGTNDTPLVTGPSFGVVTEDAPVTIGGQLSAIDPDHGATQSWSLSRSPSGYSGDYHVTVDEVKIVRNNSTIFDDTFDDGMP